MGGSFGVLMPADFDSLKTLDEDGLLREMVRLNAKVDEIYHQMTMGQLYDNQKKKTTDPFWLARAEHAANCCRREVQEIERLLRKARLERVAAWEKRFVEVARTKLTEKKFKEIAEEVGK